MKIKNLLFILPTASLEGGGEISQYELALSAKRRGYNVHAVVPNDGELAKKFQKQGIPCDVMRYFWWDKEPSDDEAKYNLTTIGTIVALAKKQNIDCIVTNSLNIPWGAFAASLLDIPHIWIAREWAEYQFSYLNDHYGYIDNFSNIILANSKTNAKYIQEKTGRKEIPYIYPYINTDSYRLDASIEETRLVNVGSIQPRKNQLELIEAAAILHKKGLLNAKVILIGPQWDEAYSNKINRVIENNKLHDWVKIYGFRENPYELVGQNDVFVMTSAYETFGRITVEAMKLGLITIAADISVTKEVINLGDGVLYKSGSARDLADKLHTVISDIDTFKKRAESGQKKVNVNLSELSCHESFFKSLSEITDQANPRAELAHLANQFEAMAKSVKSHEEVILSQQEIIKLHESKLSSKTWRAIAKAGKIIRRS